MISISTGHIGFHVFFCGFSHLTTTITNFLYCVTPHFTAHVFIICRVQEKPYRELEDSDDRPDHVVGDEVRFLICMYR